MTGGVFGQKRGKRTIARVRLRLGASAPRSGHFWEQEEVAGGCSVPRDQGRHGAQSFPNRSILDAKSGNRFPAATCFARA